MICMKFSDITSKLGKVVIYVIFKIQNGISYIICRYVCDHWYLWIAFHRPGATGWSVTLSDRKFLGHFYVSCWLLSRQEDWSADILVLKWARPRRACHDTLRFCLSGVSSLGKTTGWWSCKLLMQLFFRLPFGLFVTFNRLTLMHNFHDGTSEHMQGSC